MPAARRVPARPRPARSASALQKLVAIAVTGATFAVSLILLRDFRAVPGMQFEVTRRWLPEYGTSYHVGVDGISLWLVLLTTFLTPIALIGSWSGIHDRVKAFNIFMLLLQSAMIGVFVALDLFLFFIFWELMLIPMYFLIGIWGHERRIYAAVKFFLYTMAGSALMLVAFFALYKASGLATFDILAARPAPRRARRCRCGCSPPSRWPSPSRCRCSRSTPGCPTPTSRRPPRAR